MSTAAWEFSSAPPIAAPCVTASARPNRVTERWASWLFIVHAGRRPAGISASTVERTAARNASAFHGASIKSNANDWWNSSSLAYWRMMSGRRGAYASATSTSWRPGWSTSYDVDQLTPVTPRRMAFRSIS